METKHAEIKRLHKIAREDVAIIADLEIRLKRIVDECREAISGNPGDLSRDALLSTIVRIAEGD